MTQALSLPAIASVANLPASERAGVLDKLFEPCTQLHTLSVGLLQEKSFSSYDDMIASIGVQLTDLAESASTSDKKWLEKILGAHPRLGEKNIASVHSRAEQAQFDTGADDGSGKLPQLNEEYEKAFPGLRYV